MIFGHVLFFLFVCANETVEKVIFRDIFFSTVKLLFGKMKVTYFLRLSSRLASYSGNCIRYGVLGVVFMGIVYPLLISKQTGVRI
jgi:hypothetical protein